MALTVIVVGAGLAGLATALTLGQSGHKVKILEQSSFKNEVGAAVNVPPNASRLLRRWGLDVEKLNGVKCSQRRTWDAKENVLSAPIKAAELQKEIGNTDDWLLVHRVDLHNLLRQEVERQSNMTFELASRVVSVDSSAGSVLLQDGSLHTADLIVGADGIHSTTVEEVTGERSVSISTGQNCYRFLLPTVKARSNPMTAKFFDEIATDALDIFTSADRRIVIYPCRNGELLNIVGIHPASQSSDAEESSWLAPGSIEELKHVYKDFGPNLQELCTMAEDLKLWELSTRAPISSFFRERLVLVGDAAHPTLPHQGQGAAQGFEDAAALATLFDGKTTPENLPSRLQLYNKIRYPRALTVMFLSMVNDEKRHEQMVELRKFVPDAKFPTSMYAYTWPSDPEYEARVALDSIA